MLNDKDDAPFDNNIKVDRTDLIYVNRSIEDAVSELEAAVADGLVDESVLANLEEALEIVDEYLHK